MATRVVERIVGLLNDPIFWVSTVVCGVIVSVLGNYATRYADMLFASYRVRRSRRSEVLDAAVNAAATHVLAHPNQVYDVKLDILFFGQRAVLYSAFMVVFLVMSSYFATRPIHYTAQRWLVLATLLTALGTWVMVLISVMRERRARRVLLAYYRLSKRKTYDDFLDQSIADTSGRLLEK